MANISLNDYLASTGSFQHVSLTRAYVLGPTTLNWSSGTGSISLWQDDGMPGSGSTPITASLGGQNYDTDSTGAIKINWPESKDIYLARFCFIGIPYTVIYDRLWACSLSYVNNSTQTISPEPVIPNRYNNDYSNIELWMEVSKTPTTAPATSTSVYAYYTNQDGEANRTASIVFGPSTPKSREMIRFNLDNNDKGVKSVSGFRIEGSALTLPIHLVLLKRISDYSLRTHSNQVSYDLFKTGLVKISSGSCLGLIHYVDDIAADYIGNFFGEISFLEY